MEYDERTDTDRRERKIKNKASGSGGNGAAGAHSRVIRRDVNIHINMTVGVSDIVMSATLQMKVKNR